MLPGRRHRRDPWSPLGGGKLTRPWGTRTDRLPTDMWNKSMYDDAREDETAIVAAVERIAGDRDASMAEIALAWLLQKDRITAPIVGVSKGRARRRGSSRGGPRRERRRDCRAGGNPIGRIRCEA